MTTNINNTDNTNINNTTNNTNTNNNAAMEDYGWVEECENEEYDPEDDPDLREYYEARLACEEAAALYGTDSEEYKQACRVFEEAERKADVG